MSTMNATIKLTAGEVQQIIALHLKEQGISVKKVSINVGMGYEDRPMGSPRAEFQNVTVDIDLTSPAVERA